MWIEKSLEMLDERAKEFNQVLAGTFFRTAILVRILSYTVYLSTWWKPCERLERCLLLKAAHMIISMYNVIILRERISEND